MKINSISESTDYNYKLIRHLVEYISRQIPQTVPEDNLTYIKFSRYTLNQYVSENVYDDELKSEMIKVLESINSIILVNKKSSLNDTTMGYLKTEGMIKTIVVNLSGLMGEYNEKTKDSILRYRGPKAIKDFKSILGHEIRHVVQSIDYSHKLQSPNDQDYDYNTDPLEIDASFVEALLDIDIDEYNDIKQYTNEVFDSFKSKKPLRNKDKELYYRKIAKFFTLYKQGDKKALSLNKRLEKRKGEIFKEFINGLDAAVRIINKDFNKRLKDDYERLGSIPEDDRQSYYINIPKYDIQRTMISKLFNGTLPSISDQNAHLLVSTIVYANSINNVPNYKKVIDKIYKSAESNITKHDTLNHVSKHGYFNKNPKYLEPVLAALKGN